MRPLRAVPTSRKNTTLARNVKFVRNGRAWEPSDEERKQLLNAIDWGGLAPLAKEIGVHPSALMMASSGLWHRLKEKSKVAVRAFFETSEAP